MAKDLARQRVSLQHQHPAMQSSPVRVVARAHGEEKDPGSIRFGRGPFLGLQSAWSWCEFESGFRVEIPVHTIPADVSAEAARAGARAA